MSPWSLRRAAQFVNAGGVVAYPTEAVWGLGCHPGDAGAVARICDLKGRPLDKGVILVAATLSQLAPWIAPLDEAGGEQITAAGGAAVTWIVPAAAATPPWLTGGRRTLAVRVSRHPVTAALCRACDSALVSTSANPAGRPPARSALGVRRYFGTAIDAIVAGPTGGAMRPSEIRDLATGAVLRRG